MSGIFSGHSHRDEYILEDGGLMFRGVYNRIKPTPWNYAQYEKDILDCALYLVREIGKVFAFRFPLRNLFNFNFLDKKSCAGEIRDLNDRYP